MDQHRNTFMAMPLSLGLVPATFPVCLYGPKLLLMSIQRCPLRVDQTSIEKVSNEPSDFTCESFMGGLKYQPT